MFRPKPTLLKVLLTQYFYPTDILIFVGIVFLWGVIMPAISFGGIPNSLGLMVFSLILIGVILIVIGVFQRWRKANIVLSILRNGTEVSGIIIDAYSTKYRGGYLTYQYLYLGHDYRSTDRIRLTQTTKYLHIGQEVIVSINRSDPSQAIIRDLYL
jgi:hypothetical protein